MKKYLMITALILTSTLVGCQKDNSQEEERVKMLEEKVAQQEVEIKQQQEQQKEQQLADKEAELLAKELELQEKEQQVDKKAQSAKKATVQAKATLTTETYNKRFEVIVDKASFFSKPHSSSKKKSYLLYGDEGQTTKRSNGYVYVTYVNVKGQVSKGWVDDNDLAYY